MAKFSEQMRHIFDRYTSEVDASPVSLDSVAAWAIGNGLFRPAPRDVAKLCKEALAESLRQERRTDASGRTYRAKHSVRDYVGGIQLSLWADIDTVYIGDRPRFLHLDLPFSSVPQIIVALQCPFECVAEK